MPSPLTDWRLWFNAGARLLSKGHKVSLDGKFAVAVFKYHLRVYSLATRQSIRIIDIDTDLSSVTDTYISSNHPSWIYLFTTTGEILVVDWKDTSLKDNVIKRIRYPWKSKKTGSVLKLVDFDEDNQSFTFIVGRRSEGPHKRLLVKFKEGEEPIQLYEAANTIHFAVSLDGRHVAFVTTNREVHTVSLGANVVAKQMPYIHRAAVTSVAISSDDNPLVALGTSSGVIQVFYEGSDPKAQRLLKWHVDAVKALEFNADASYLISGGQEKVLVFWQLETEKQQFLPRLNGPIDDICLDSRVGQYYGVTLQLTDNTSTENGYMEYLVLNSLDLTSRLDVNGIRPKFASNLERTLEKDNRKMIKQSYTLNNDNFTKVHHDLSCDFKVHPESKMIYLPYGSSIQVYDLVHNDQHSVTQMASTLQTGKVRGETLIQDPSVEHFAFTNHGKWMCTFDSLKTPPLDHLMSENDIEYSLKFWRYDDTKSIWELCTKILDPHGPEVGIAAIQAAPGSFHDGLAFITADTKGGVRLWRPRVPKEVYAKQLGKKPQQTAWTLRRLHNGTGRLVSNSVDVAWSRDGSIIALGQETTVTLIDANTFDEIDTPMLPSIADSMIRAIEIIGDNLIVLTKHKLVSFSLLTYQTGELCVRVNTTLGGKSLLAIDTDRDLLCLCVNYYTHKDNKYPLHSRIFVLQPDSIKPLYICDHAAAISGVKYSRGHSGFVLLDSDYRIGVLNTVTSKFLLQEEEKKQLDKSHEMNTLLNNAQMVAKTAKAKASADGEEQYSRSVLNATTFESLVTNMDGLPVEALFDRVMNLL